jgi:transcriptional regulator with XRE-family HTH domain
MAKTLRSPRQEALRRYLIGRRKEAELTQADVASRLGHNQSYVAKIESGQRRVDVVELLELAEAIGFDPVDALRAAQRARR